MVRYVLGFMLSKEGEVVLIKKTKPHWQAGRFNGVGGKIEPGESAHVAMAREFEEETGVDTTIDQWELRAIMNAPDDKVLVFRCVVDKLPEVQTTTEEEVCVVPTNALPETALHSVKYLVPMLCEVFLNVVTLEYL